MSDVQVSTGLRRGGQWLAIVAIASLALAAPVAAHHGTNASYDPTKPTQLSGTVTEFVWKNPHCQLYFSVKDATGKVTGWGGELNSPSVLRREGWSKQTFKPGDQITLTVFPSRAGAPLGVIDRRHPIVANGKEVVPARAQNFD
jgi:hypothetical protein